MIFSKKKKPHWLDTRDVIILQFGRTLAAWAELEHSLALWFQEACGMTDPILSDALFYSGRSFNTRADLLRAALAKGHMQAEWELVGRAIVKRAMAYSATRNAIAHGVVLPDPDKERYVIGSRTELPSETSTTIDDLKQAEANFIRLETAIYDALGTKLGTLEGKPEEYLELIQRLPSEADSKEDTQKPPARKPRARSSPE